MSWIRTISSVALAGSLFLPPAIVDAQGRGHGHSEKANKPEKEKHADATAHATTNSHDLAIDRDGHARVIREYVQAGSLPPGLAKREALPPGLRAQMHERGTLPPGLQKRFVEVPVPLVTRLPPVPPYYHRYFAGNDLIVVDTRTNRIAAIVRDVWR